MSILVINELPTQTYSLSPQRYLPHIEALTVESLGYPSSYHNVPLSLENSTMVNIQSSNLLVNYRSLADTIGFDQSLDDLIQFGILDLSSVLNTVPHFISSSNIPPPLTLKRPYDLTQHGRSQVQTSLSSIRNRVITQPSQPVMNSITIHSLVQYAVNTIGTQHPVSSQVMIPPSGVLIQPPTVIVP